MKGNTTTTDRAGWTAMHTTAMYLPDTLSDVEKKSFIDLLHFSLLYPGAGGELAEKILTNAVFVDEIKAAKTREDCMLVIWKCAIFIFPCVDVQYFA